MFLAHITFYIYIYFFIIMLKVVESASTKALNMQRSKEKKLEELEDIYRIDINIATFEEIKVLPGISVILAKKISQNVMKLAVSTLLMN